MKMLTGTKGIVTGVAAGIAVGAVVGALVKTTTAKATPSVRRTAIVTLGAVGDAMSYVAKSLR